MKTKAILLTILGVVVLAAMLFVPAGTLSYWQAWLYMGVLFVPMSTALGYFLKHDPALLERRMRMKEKEMVQRGLIRWASIIFFLAFLVPGFDQRFGWSDVPAALAIICNYITLAGYLLVLRTLRENSYASRVVEVEKGQKVITTGPYAVVRHPMYVGVLLMFLSTPLALGSYWAIIGFVPLVPIIVLRTLNEEEVLRRDLPGYKEYCQKTRYRLIPYLW